MFWQSVLNFAYVIQFSLQAAIISLGLIGAGTNNARIAAMLRNLSSYYYKDASALFCVWHLIVYTLCRDLLWCLA